MDWFFIDRYLKAGGFLVIDGLEIPSVKTRYRYLLKEPDYKFERIVGIGTAAFRKPKRVRATAESNWDGRSMNVAYPDRSYLSRHN